MFRYCTAFTVAISVVSFFGFTLAALFFVYAVAPWADQTVVPSFGSRIHGTAAFGVAGLLCVFVSIRLVQAKTWAWWTAFAVSAITLGLGIFLFVSALHPRDDFARSEGGFGLGISLMLMMPGALCVGLLSLPMVRRRFFLSTGGAN